MKPSFYLFIFLNNRQVQTLKLHDLIPELESVFLSVS